MSNVRMIRSTPAAARVVLRYLFQSCERASLGGKVGWGLGIVDDMTGGAWIGICNVRWLLALAGVLRSQTRIWLSEHTALRIPSVCGLHWTLYVQECVGSVRILC